MDSYEELIEGYNIFRAEYLDKKSGAYHQWASASPTPRVMIVGCSDSQVNPAILTHAGLGEIFVVNNVANIVPPFKSEETACISVGAAIQYAVNHQKVEHIIVMGHSACGGVAALMDKAPKDRFDADANDCIASWVNILDPAKRAVLENCDEDCDKEECLRLAEMEGTLFSMQNLAGYPWVRDAVKENRLTLHAWYFHIDSGELLSYRPSEGCFRRLCR